MTRTKTFESATPPAHEDKIRKTELGIKGTDLFIVSFNIYALYYEVPVRNGMGLRQLVVGYENCHPLLIGSDLSMDLDICNWGYYRLCFFFSGRSQRAVLGNCLSTLKGGLVGDPARSQSMLYVRDCQMRKCSILGYSAIMMCQSLSLYKSV